MTQSNSIPVTVRILEKEFTVACPETESEALLRSASYLNEKMSEVRNNRVIGLERIAIMAALNITHELLELKATQGNTPPADLDTIAASLRSLQHKVDKILDEGRQIEL